MNNNYLNMLNMKIREWTKVGFNTMFADKFSEMVAERDTLEKKVPKEMSGMTQVSDITVREVVYAYTEVGTMWAHIEEMQKAGFQTKETTITKDGWSISYQTVILGVEL